MQKFSAFFENSQKTAGFSANGPPKARCSGQKPRHGRADTVFCLGAERGPRPLLFPGRLAQALPPHASGVCFGRSFHLRRPGKRSPARAVPVQKSSAQSAHVSPMRRPKNVVPRQRPFPFGSKEQPMPPRPSPAQKGTARLRARSPRCVSGHCARSIRQTMAEICPRVMVLAGLKVLVPLEK